MLDTDVSEYNLGWLRHRIARLHCVLPVMYLVYSLLFTLGLVIAAPYYLWRLRRELRAGSLLVERFGFLPAALQQESCGAIWVHAVSVGETLAVATLVREVQRRFPKRRVFLSHVTPAGREAGRKRLPEVAGSFYLPLDWAWCVRRILRRIRPDLLMIVETELWPNLLRTARNSGARIILVNGRLSDRSFPRYRALRALTGRMLDNVDYICTQTPRDRDRFVLLGARPDRVRSVGNLKYDSTPLAAAPLAAQLTKAAAMAQRSPIIMAASTMPGEEPLVLQAWRTIRDRYPQALLILVPRHPTRFDAVAGWLASTGVSYVRRSELDPDPKLLREQLAFPEVLLLDTVGELAGTFAVADLVFMGGSLVPTGGHNLLEPAFWSKAILMGPHMYNFRDMEEEFVAAGAGVQVRDPVELGIKAVDLLADQESRREMGLRARQLLEKGAGATARTMACVEELLGA